MRTRPEMSWVLLLALCLAAVGCSEELPGLGGLSGEIKPVLGASPVEGRPAAVAVRFSGCDADPPIDVDESDTEIEITVHGSGGCEPLHRTVVPLDAELGQRTIVDGSTGEVVPLTPEEL